MRESNLCKEILRRKESRKMEKDQYIAELEDKIEVLKETIGELVMEKDRLTSLLDDIKRSLSIIDDDINNYDRNKR